MLRIVLCTLALCLAPAAFGQALVGEWLLDVDALANDPDIQRLAPEKRAQTLKMIRTAMAQIRIEVTAERFILHASSTAKKEATYTMTSPGHYVAQVDGKPIPLHVTGDLLKMESPHMRLYFSRKGGKAIAAPADSALVRKPVDFIGDWIIDADATLLATDKAKRPRVASMLTEMVGLQVRFEPGTMSVGVGKQMLDGTYTHRSTVDGVTTLDTLSKDGRMPAMLERVGAYLLVTNDGKTVAFRRATH